MDNIKVVVIVVGMVLMLGIAKGCDYSKEVEINAVNNGLTYINAGWYPVEMFKK